MAKSIFSRSGLSLERLRTFSQIVAAGGISNAAPGDTNRQSQFSRQLKELEEFFGAELVRRRRGHFELTALGRELSHIVESHFNSLEELAARCEQHNVEVTIGAGESLLHWLVMPSFGQFRVKEPNITLVLSNLQTDEIIAQLLDGRLDIGLVRHDAIRTPLKSTRLGAIEHRLVVPNEVRSVGGKRRAWDVLKRVPVAVLAGSAITSILEAECVRRGIKPNVCLRASSFLQLVEAVKQTKCAAILPLFAAHELIEAGAESLELNELKALVRPISLVWHPRFAALRPTVGSARNVLAELLSDALSAATALPQTLTKRK